MLIVYAVHDCKADAYGSPMFLPTKGLALRGFSDACADAASPLAAHPGDYSLYEIGSFDPNSGLLTAVTPTKFVVSASSIVSLLHPAGPPAPRNAGPADGRPLIKPVSANGGK